ARAGQAVALEERDKADAATREADEQRKVAERQAASTTIDLYDGMSSDASDDGRRAHLLLARLARTLPPHAADLREYITARLVYDLQGVAPLDDRLTGHTASPDGRYVIAHADNGGLGVYEFPSGRRVAGLREGDERDGRVGFGPDGRLAYTLSADGVVRVWDVPTGRLRLRAGPLPFPWHTTAADLGPDRLAVRRVAHPSEPDPRGPNPVWLWDVTEGRFVGRLDGHAGPVDVAFAPDGRAVVTSGRRGGPARVWSAADGRLLAELPHDGPVAEAAFSPSGRRLVTVSDRENGGTVRWWDAGSGRPLGPPLRWDRSPAAGPITPTLFLGEDEAVIRSGEAVAVVRPSGLVAQAPVSGWDVVVDPAARTATDGRRLVRLDTGRVELPGPGRRYHPGAAAFARGGRWLAVPRNLIDLTAEKDLVVYDGWTSTAVSPVPGGYAAHPAADGMSLPARYVPVPNAAVPADLLERWVQVVVCGGLGADEAFVPWDEPTWERHRAELAATPPPLPDFPFPGRVATDRWYWLKRRYKQVEADDAKAFPLLDRLVAAEPKPEWYDRRGNLNARLGRWSAAADDYLAAKADVGAFARGWADKPGEPAEKYRAAVRLAEAARRADPDNWEAASALGMALYRAGRDREAVRALAEASALYRLGESARRVVGPVLLSPWAGLAADPATHDHPTNLAFRAMAHHRLGEADLARARLADLAPALLAHAGSGHPLFDGTDDLRREAEATLAAPPAPAPK
ncbi:MAG: hypothetical protein K2X82_30325, partial [Gemmataceae bacterium]|nr:hypothetical protein [Gemmataceae bacterium]